jgi:hypothetical protein
MGHLLAQLNGMVSQISEANPGYILNLLFSPGFGPNKWLPQLTGDPINQNPVYMLTDKRRGGNVLMTSLFRKSVRLTPRTRVLL